MLLSDFQPCPKLVVSETIVTQPRFPVIDAHNHLGNFAGIEWDGWYRRTATDLLDLLDQVGVRTYISLDGGWGEATLQRDLDRFKAVAPERFVLFGGVDWSAWAEHPDDFGEWAAERLRTQASWGAQGLKIWKNLGLSTVDADGRLVAVDDPRLDPIWAIAGELRLPVVIHVADPVAFFDPVNGRNERWEELQTHPDWQFPSPPFPAFMEIMRQFSRLVQRHPKTVFIGAHVGCYAENLDWVGTLLDRCPNFYVDMSARIGELGRRPYSARDFFLKYADRILFGTDSPASFEVYRLYYRFLETRDEYFNYDTQDPPGQGRWRIYGLHLPDDVLEKVYYRNAQRVLLQQHVAED
jgi:predicted TIM-barrel fold metal-dependent hydrolase